MELRVPLTHLPYPIQRRRRDNAAERARHAVTHVVSHDQKNVWRAFRGHNLRRPIWRGSCSVEVDLTAELRRLRRKIFPIYCRRGAGRTWNARRLLRERGNKGEHGQRRRRDRQCGSFHGEPP